MSSTATTHSAYRRPTGPLPCPGDRYRTRRWLQIVALLYCLPALATTVYKSVDESGATRFSDTPPGENAPVEEVKIDVPEAPPGDEAQRRLEEMRETTDRMASDRMAREKHRAEMRELQAKTDAMRAPQYYPVDDYYRTVYTGGYGYYPYTPYYRPPGRIRPEHPIVKPPLSPHTEKMLHDQFPAPHIRPLFTPRTRGAPRE